MGNLGTQLLKYLPQATFDRSAESALANARENLPYIKHTVAELDPKKTGQNTDLAMVMASGPSLHRKNPAELVVKYGLGGPLVVAESAMGYCLRNGLVPDYVVTVDPDHDRIVRWFGDPELEQKEEDEYFLRQELDPAMQKNGLSWNSTLIDLVNEHGPKIKAIICTSASSSVRTRCIDSGMELYWWNPMFDDYELPNSLSRQIYELTKAPCMVTGGNVGTSAFVFTAAILKAKNVVLTGMDLGYPPDHPITETQYYPELLDMFDDRVAEAFIPIYNPHLHETWYADPTYYWFREGFLELASMTSCNLYNCSEGGTLFGPRVNFMKLEPFLKKARRGLP